MDKLIYIKKTFNCLWVDLFICGYL